MMNNTAKEQLGVHYLSQELLSTCQLIPNIEYNDKTPSFDGTIEIYPEDSVNKKDLIGIVDVQVKTTEDKQKTNHYYINKEDLQNFLHRSGVIFFVVFIDEDRNPHIFYKDLHVWTIMNFLHNSKKKKVAINLYQFPEDRKGIVNTFLNFLELRGMNEGIDKRNEISKRLCGNFIRQGKDFNLHYAFSHDSTHQDIIDFILNHKTLIFDSIDDSSFEIPVGEFQPQQVSEIIQRPVRIGDTVFYDSYTLLNNKDGWEVIIGNCFHKYSGNKNVLLTTEDIPMLSERLKALEFIIALYKGKDFFLGEKKVNYPITKKDYSEEILTVEKTYSLLSLVQTFLNEIKISDDFDFSKSSEYQWDQLATIAESYINRTPLTFKNPKKNDSLVMYIQAGNLNLLLYFHSDAEMNYYCENFFEGEDLITFVIEEKTQKKFIMSKYLKLVPEDFIKASNINYFEIEKSLFHYELTSVNEGIITQLILCMITAFDQSDSTRFDILESAKRISEKLIIEKTGKSCEIETINLFQIIARQRELNISEIENLIMIKNSFDNINGKICANILLKNFAEAETLYNSLSENEKEIFNGYPICQLWGKEYNLDNIARNLPMSSKN